MGMNYSHLITVEPGKRSGQPCVRGMRITVRDVLEYLAGGMTLDELLADFPELTPEDVRACLAYAAASETYLPRRRRGFLLPRSGPPGMIPLPAGAGRWNPERKLAPRSLSQIQPPGRVNTGTRRRH